VEISDCCPNHEFSEEECLSLVILNGVKRNEESRRFLAEFILSGVRFFATLRMTGSERLRMTKGGSE